MDHVWLFVLVVGLCRLGGCVDDIMGAEGGYMLRDHSLVAPYQGDCYILWLLSTSLFVDELSVCVNR